MNITIIWTLLMPPAVLAVESGNNAQYFAKAEANASQEQEALLRSNSFLHAWIKLFDKDTHLFGRDLAHMHLWAPSDNASDNYPFMVLTAMMLDHDALNSMKKVLDAERKLTSRVGHLPDDYDFVKGKFIYKDVNIYRIVFGSAEYAKDALIPILEWYGDSPWSERLIEIMDDIATYTPMPESTKITMEMVMESHGNLLQAYSRLYWKTGNPRYANMVFQLADHYLLHDHPTRTRELLVLTDHGNEIIAGLSEAYVIAWKIDPVRYKQYRQPLYNMLDDILAYGRNKDGFLYRRVLNRDHKNHAIGLADTWGYVYNAFYTVYMVDGTTRYRDAVAQVLGNLKGYILYAWPDKYPFDGYADAIESAFYLYNRFQEIDSVKPWIEAQIRVMWGMQRPDGLVQGEHVDGNFTRTTLMYALWKSQGTRLEPWREDTKIGAVQHGGHLYVSISTEKAWAGNVLFDTPRHREHLSLPIDYPRLNSFPEWFVVDRTQDYRVTINNKESARYSGDALAQGIKLDIPAHGNVTLELTKI